MEAKRQPKPRRVETAEQRAARLSASEIELNEERLAESDALDAMVRRSIAVHGA
jgi:hypothetical protein